MTEQQQLLLQPAMHKRFELIAQQEGFQSQPLRKYLCDLLDAGLVEEYDAFKAKMNFAFEDERSALLYLTKLFSFGKDNTFNESLLTHVIILHPRSNWYAWGVPKNEREYLAKTVPDLLKMTWGCLTNPDYQPSLSSSDTENKVDIWLNPLITKYNLKAPPAAEQRLFFKGILRYVAARKLNNDCLNDHDSFSTPSSILNMSNNLFYKQYYSNFFQYPTRLAGEALREWLFNCQEQLPENMRYDFPSHAIIPFIPMESMNIIHKYRNRQYKEWLDDTMPAFEDRLLIDYDFIRKNSGLEPIKIIKRLLIFLKNNSAHEKCFTIEALVGLMCYAESAYYKNTRPIEWKEWQAKKAKIFITPLPNSPLVSAIDSRRIHTLIIERFPIGELFDWLWVQFDGFKHLDTLTLDRAGINDSHMSRIAKKLNQTRIRHLELSGHLVFQPHEKLSEYYKEDTRETYSDKGLIELAKALKTNNQLVHLGIQLIMGENKHGMCIGGDYVFPITRTTSSLFTVLDAVRNNPKSQLRTVDISGLPWNKHIVKLHKYLCTTHSSFWGYPYHLIDTLYCANRKYKLHNYIQKKLTKEQLTEFWQHVKLEPCPIGNVLTREEQTKDRETQANAFLQEWRQSIKKTYLGDVNATELSDTVFAQKIDIADTPFREGLVYNSTLSPTEFDKLIGTSLIRLVDGASQTYATLRWMELDAFKDYVLGVFSQHILQLIHNYRGKPFFHGTQIDSLVKLYEAAQTQINEPGEYAGDIPPKETRKSAFHRSLTSHLIGLHITMQAISGDTIEFRDNSTAGQLLRMGRALMSCSSILSGCCELLQIAGTVGDAVSKAFDSPIVKGLFHAGEICGEAFEVMEASGSTKGPIHHFIGSVREHIGARDLPNRARTTIKKIRSEADCSLLAKQVADTMEEQIDGLVSTSAVHQFAQAIYKQIAEMMEKKDNSMWIHHPAYHLKAKYFDQLPSGPAFCLVKTGGQLQHSAADLFAKSGLKCHFVIGRKWYDLSFHSESDTKLQDVSWPKQAPDQFGYRWMLIWTHSLITGIKVP